MSYPRTVRRRLAILASLALMAAACSEEGPPADPYADGVRAARAADPSAAAEAYRAAIEASPRDDRAWAGLTRAQLRLGVDATESARRLSALAPGYTVTIAMDELSITGKEITGRSTADRIPMSNRLRQTTTATTGLLMKRSVHRGDVGRGIIVLW